MGKELYFSDYKYKQFQKACLTFTDLVRTADNEDLKAAGSYLMDTIKRIMNSSYKENTVVVLDSSEVYAELNRAWGAVANDGLCNFPDDEMSGKIMVALDRVVDTFKAFFDLHQRTMQDLISNHLKE